MDIGSILLLLSLSILVALFISRPFFVNARGAFTAAADEWEHDRSSLLAERDSILNSLYELDFDHALGKIPQEDYPQQRALLLEQGAEILRQLDALPDEPPTDETRMRREARETTRQEALQPTGAINPGANINQKTKPAVSTEPNDELEALLAQRRRSRQAKASGFCPKCGGPMAKSDRFCPKCGFKLEPWMKG